MIDQIESRGAKVCDFHALFELEVGGQKTRHVGTDAVIPQQDVSNSANQDLLHIAFAFIGLLLWQSHGLTDQTCGRRRPYRDRTNGLFARPPAVLRGAPAACAAATLRRDRERRRHRGDWRSMLTGRLPGSS